MTGVSGAARLLLSVFGFKRVNRPFLVSLVRLLTNFFLQLLVVLATILERNPEVELSECIDLDEVRILEPSLSHNLRLPIENKADAALNEKFCCLFFSFGSPVHLDLLGDGPTSSLRPVIPDP